MTKFYYMETLGAQGTQIWLALHTRSKKSRNSRHDLCTVSLRFSKGFAELLVPYIAAEQHSVQACCWSGS